MRRSSYVYKIKGSIISFILYVSLQLDYFANGRRHKLVPHSKFFILTRQIEIERVGKRERATIIIGLIKPPCSLAE